MEHWKIIADYPNYEVSNLGRIRRRTSSRGTKAGLILKNSRDTNGYAVVNLFRDGEKARKHYVHRVVAMAFVSNPQNLPQVAHWDGDGMNASADNLRWVEQADNEHDKRRHGRANYARRGSYVFTPEQVDEMRRLRDEGLSIRRIGLMFEKSHTTIRHAILEGSAL